MAKLNQIVAIEKGIKAAAYSALTDWHKLAQKPDLFNGFQKTYQKRDEDSEDLPSEQKRVQQTVPVMLRAVQQTIADLWQVTARKEWSNGQATASVIVAGVTILADVPVTYLLFLEKQVTDLRTFVEKLPILDVTEDWQADPTTDLYKTLPVSTHRTKKNQRPLVLYPATPEHPAQTQLITEDIVAGYWSTVKYSGAMTAPDQRLLAEKVEALLRAVKEAREAANNREESAVPSVSTAIFGYLFG